MTRLKKSLGSRKYLHPDAGLVPDKLIAASVVEGTGRLKLVSDDSPSANCKAIVVFKNRICKSGTGSYMGDTIGWYCSECGKKEYAPRPDQCPDCAAEAKPLIMPFPGRILAECNITSPYSGRHLIALVDVGQVFQTSFNDERGEKIVQYFMWDGRDLLSASPSERERDDCF
ncbi:MAG: hypothetical protein PVI21_03095 [Candidatus Woesebacteria bacterium]|jgi:hypothetical protein